ncbi:Membrane transport protein [Halalkalibacter krulwichiae]|uniref:Membrane transport protein n=2 Tax=Halalkalibacter krulwichiae TaxID=199441 RepID=A0A1X9MGC0_9BACI|nr:Membrane transport protein [Halalkalibacter krulwichiae]
MLSIDGGGKMDAVFGLAQEMLVLLAIALIGLIMRKGNVLPRETNFVLTQVILYITLPCLIIYSMDIEFSLALLVEFSWLMGMSLFSLCLGSVIGYLMRKRSKLEQERQGVYEATIIFGNQGFIGYAIAFLLFGELGVLYAAFFMIFYQFYVWTYVIYVVARVGQKITWQQLVLNPGVLATTVGFLVMLLPFRLPVMFSDVLADIGMMTLPLSMILIGSLLAAIDFSSFKKLMKNKYIWYATGAKLLLIPFLLTPFLWLPVSTIIVGVALLVTATPSAPTVSMYAQKYGGDATFSSVIVAITTVLCIITIPLLYALILFVR